MGMLKLAVLLIFLTWGIFYIFVRPDRESAPGNREESRYGWQREKRGPRGFIDSISMIHGTTQIQSQTRKMKWDMMIWMMKFYLGVSGETLLEFAITLEL